MDTGLEGRVVRKVDCLVAAVGDSGVRPTLLRDENREVLLNLCENLLVNDRGPVRQTMKRTVANCP